MLDDDRPPDLAAPNPAPPKTSPVSQAREKGPAPERGSGALLKAAGDAPVDQTIRSAASFRTSNKTYLMILVTRPAPTVRPPSRMAKRRPSSIATGWIRVTDMSTLSPGMTISVPSGSFTTPVTSVVRK